MSGRRRVAFLAFDACDIGLVRELAFAGKLPTFHLLLREWAHAPVQNPAAFFANSVWPTFYTAKSEARLGYHCWETVSPRYEHRLTSPLEVKGRPFWYELSAAGRRVAVLDVPHWMAAERNDLLEVSEYATHDRHFGLRTSPSALRDQIVSRFGFHPIFAVEPFAERTFAGDDYVHRAGPLRTAAEETALLKGFLTGLRRKAEVSRWIYHQEQWDLFMSVFGEGHGVGHQAWHLHDANHPRHNAALVRDMGDPVEKVYAALDDALAEHLALFGSDSTIFVLLSHGMGVQYDGTHILEAVLGRLDAFNRLAARGKRDHEREFDSPEFARRVESNIRCCRSIPASKTRPEHF